MNCHCPICGSALLRFVYLDAPYNEGVLGKIVCGSCKANSPETFVQGSHAILGEPIEEYFLRWWSAAMEGWQK